MTSNGSWKKIYSDKPIQKLVLKGLQSIGFKSLNRWTNGSARLSGFDWFGMEEARFEENTDQTDATSDHCTNYNWYFATHQSLSREHCKSHSPRLSLLGQELRLAKHWLLPAFHLCSANVFDVAIVFANVLDVSILGFSSAGREGFLQTFGIGVSNTTKLFVCGIRFSLGLKGKFML